MKHIEDMVLDTFVGVNFKPLIKLPIITIYDSPKDYPDKFVARLWDINNTPTRFIVIADTIEGIRTLIPRNLTCIPPTEVDDPVIVEVYI